MSKITKRFYHNFCPCPEWQKQRREQKGREFISTAMLYLPDVCPFCKGAIQQTLLFTEIKLVSENDADVYCFATLAELKALLKEVK